MRNETNTFPHVPLTPAFEPLPPLGGMHFKPDVARSADTSGAWFGPRPDLLHEAAGFQDFGPHSSEA